MTQKLDLKMEVSSPTWTKARLVTHALSNRFSVVNFCLKTLNKYPFGNQTQQKFFW